MGGLGGLGGLGGGSPWLLLCFRPQLPWCPSERGRRIEVSLLFAPIYAYCLLLTPIGSYLQLHTLFSVSVVCVGVVLLTAFFSSHLSPKVKGISMYFFHTYMFTRYMSTQVIVHKVLQYPRICESVSIQTTASSTISLIAFIRSYCLLRALIRYV